jgi:cyclopropane-fatty-acyl-phospholipid synthase
MSVRQVPPVAVSEPAPPVVAEGEPGPVPPGLLGLLTRWLVSRLRSIPVRIQLWNGAVLTPPFEPALATLVLRRPRTLLWMLLNPLFAFGEAYRAGEAEVKGNLVGALTTLYRRWTPPPPQSVETVMRSRWTLRRAGRSARHHYDRGNEFFRLWLDDQMVYTCAYFPSPRLSLEEAQIAKMDYVCRKLRIQPGDRVLEAGCGWGALARHMALRYGAQVTACNVSGEQIRYARERAAEEGLEGRVSFVEDDFRNMSGTYDVFVSVGMLEHVGVRHYRNLGRLIHDRLDARHGRGLLHFIGRNRSQTLNYWLRMRIFPNVYSPTLSEVFQRVLEPWDFSILDVENLRLHYAQTLAHWLQRFEKTRGAAAAMFDEPFLRTWRLYLSGSQAAFTAGSLQLFQVVFARGSENQIPLTRATSYPEASRAEA